MFINLTNGTKLSVVCCVICDTDSHLTVNINENNYIGAKKVQLAIKRCNNGIR